MARVSAAQVAALLRRQSAPWARMNEVELTFVSPLRPSAIAIRGAEIGWRPSDEVRIAVFARTSLESSEWREIAQAELLAAVPGVDPARTPTETRSLYGLVSWPAPAEPCAAVKVRLVRREPSGAEAVQPIAGVAEISVFGER